MNGRPHMIDENILIPIIDEFLKEISTATIIEARIARDQLMDLRLMLMAAIDVPNTIESIAEINIKVK